MVEDREAKFLDALYFGAKGSSLFDRAMGQLADRSTTSFNRQPG
jgi:hypothetical protein